MPLQVQQVGATADLTIRVPRDADGTLTDGARTVLTRLDGVTDVDELTVTGVKPRLNDLTVEAHAAVVVDADGTLEDVERVLDGFGVTVEEVALAR